MERGADILNSVMVMGRPTKDPLVKRIPVSDLCVANFFLAVSRKGTKENATDYIPMVAFGKVAEIIDKFVRQGTKILVTGCLRTSTYTNKEGRKVYNTEVLVLDIDFVESKAAEMERRNRELKETKDGYTDRSYAGTRSNRGFETDSNGFIRVDDRNLEDELPFM